MDFLPKCSLMSKVHRVQHIYHSHRYLRIWHCKLQTLVFQCNREHHENLDINGDCSNYTLRMCKTFNRPNDHEVRSLFHDFSFLPINIFALLRLVGLCKLLQRWFLQPMESPNVFYGNFLPLWIKWQQNWIKLKV